MECVDLVHLVSVDDHLVLALWLPVGGAREFIDGVRNAQLGFLGGCRTVANHDGCQRILCPLGDS